MSGFRGNHKTMSGSRKRKCKRKRSKHRSKPYDKGLSPSSSGSQSGDSMSSVAGAVIQLALSTDQTARRTELMARPKSSEAVDIRSLSGPSPSVVATERWLQLNAVTYLFQGRQDLAMKYLEKAMYYRSHWRHLFAPRRQDPPGLASKLGIKEPRTRRALLQMAASSDSSLLALAIESRLQVDPDSHLQNLLIVGRRLVAHDRARAIILFQHACHVGLTLGWLEMSVLEEVYVTMETLRNSPAFDFQCFVSLLRLLSHWAIHFDDLKLSEDVSETEIRPFNSALKLYATQRPKDGEFEGEEDAVRDILQFVQVERQDEYSTYHFTDSRGVFRRDWFDLKVVQLLAYFSARLAGSQGWPGKLPLIWRTDVRGRTPFFRLVESLNRKELFDQGVFGFMLSIDMCLCSPENLHRFRISHALLMRFNYRSRYPDSLMCLAARACRRHFPQSLLEEHLPKKVAAFCEVH